MITKLGLSQEIFTYQGDHALDLSDAHRYSSGVFKSHNTSSEETGTFCILDWFSFTTDFTPWDASSICNSSSNNEMSNMIGCPPLPLKLGMVIRAGDD